jgi:hypothetical protein
VREAIIAGSNDSMIPMPPIERDVPQVESQESSGASAGTRTSFMDVINIIFAIISFVSLIAKCSG